MKTNTSTPCCCYSPQWGLWILRLAVALLFFFPGFGKLMDTAGPQGMIDGLTGMSGVVTLILVWILIAFELGGSIVVLFGKIAPKMLYKIALMGQGIILLVALFMMTIPSGDMMSILFHVLGVAAVITLITTAPMCPFNISGDKDMSCSTK